MKTILFNNNRILPGIRFTKEFRDFLAWVFTNECVELKRVSYIFCKDDYLLALNQKYLKQDKLTDILTFNLSECSGAIESDIFISIERVKENALLLKTTYRKELFRVMIHGILHLCGYNDSTVKQKAEMRKKENYYISLLSST